MTSPLAAALSFAVAGGEAVVLMFA